MEDLNQRVRLEWAVQGGRPGALTWRKRGRAVSALAGSRPAAGCRCHSIPEMLGVRHPGRRVRARGLQLGQCVELHLTIWIEVASNESPGRPSESRGRPDKTSVQSDESLASSNKTPDRPDKSRAHADKSRVHADKSRVHADKSRVNRDSSPTRPISFPERPGKTRACPEETPGLHDKTRGCPDPASHADGLSWVHRMRGGEILRQCCCVVKETRRPAGVRSSVKDRSPAGGPSG